jgi:hypothetical protein
MKNTKIVMVQPFKSTFDVQYEKRVLNIQRVELTDRNGKQIDYLRVELSDGYVIIRDGMEIWYRYEAEQE